LVDWYYYCYRCGKKYPRGVRFRCECGEPLFVGYHYAEARDYRELFPCEGIKLGEGYTPLLQLDGVFIKNEGLNPTLSFKDRGTSIGVAMAMAFGFRSVGAVSTGNMAISVATYAAYLGLRCEVIVHSGAPSSKLKALEALGAELKVVEPREYSAWYYRSLRSRTTYFINSDNPFRVEGQKTCAFELFEQVGKPTEVILPVSSGGNISALWKGFIELKELGYLEEVPRFVAAQAEGCSPIVRAFREKLNRVVPVEEPRTIASAIANGDPPSGNRALYILRKTDGLAVAVSDEEILEAAKALARRGIIAELASAAAYAAYLKVRNELGERPVVIITGSGFK